MNFYSPFPLVAGLVLTKEKEIGEWSEDNAGGISVSLIAARYLKQKNNLIFSVENLSGVFIEMWSVFLLYF